MPPVKAVPAKGQTSLFSFFKKAPISTVSPSAAAQEGKQPVVKEEEEEKVPNKIFESKPLENSQVGKTKIANDESPSKKRKISNAANGEFILILKI